MRLLGQILLCVCVLSVPALAQIQTNLDPEGAYFPIILFTDPPFGQCLGSSIPANGAWCFALNPSNTTLPRGVSIGTFARDADFRSFATTTRADIESLSRRTFLDSRKLFSLVAVSAAIQDAIPNSGDRFAFRINAAGFSGTVAGAVGASMNFGKRARLSFNYGQARSEQIVSGGLNFSIR